MPLKYQTWALLASMAKDVDEPWLVIGDINQVLGPENKMEGNPVDLAKIDNARTCLEVCNMKDIDWVGQKFTWCNRRKQPDTIEEHIDKAFSNTTWSQVWNYSKVSHLPRYSSDHSPIILDALMRTNQDARKKEKETIQDWSGTTFGNMSKRIVQLRNRLAELQSQRQTYDNLEEEDKISKNLMSCC
ncbi:hypothetical protein RIF29_21111 [Crotalaria pallida]|uniref:Endonuclease/exonuclease/phosphatase domain-containing protein n=1 Tax=Crotalaria pallida TaxID=3830 RepID=A0AAN9FAY4_CROPI